MRVEGDRKEIRLPIAMRPKRKTVYTHLLSLETR